MRVASLEQDIGQFVDQTPQVASVLSVKKDNGVLWFYVQWDSETKSFIPARVLNKIAPEKVIEFYESVLTFQPDKDRKQLDLEKLNQEFLSDIPSDSQKKPPISPDIETKPEVPSSIQKELKSDTRQAPISDQPTTPSQSKDEERTKHRKQLFSKQQQQQQHLLQQQLLQQQLQIQQPKPPYHTMNCTGCNILLQYPDGTTAKIKCPACHAIMQAL